MSDFWNERYAGSSFVYGSEPNDFLREQVGLLPQGGEVLCVAEGEGRNAVFLASQGMRVTGVDGSNVGLDKAQNLAAERGVQIETVVGDLSDWDLGETRWDAVVSIWAHLPAPLRTGLHLRIAKALRPGGVVLFEHYHPRQLDYKTGGPPEASMMLTLEELRLAFDGWEELVAIEKEREVHEGKGHHGQSYVSQFVAKKPG